MARSQPIVYTLSLTQTLTQSLLHTPLPHPYLLVHLLYSNSLTHFFTFLPPCAPSCLRTRSPDFTTAVSTLLLDRHRTLGSMSSTV